MDEPEKTSHSDAGEAKKKGLNVVLNEDLIAELKAAAKADATHLHNPTMRYVLTFLETRQLMLYVPPVKSGVTPEKTVPPAKSGITPEKTASNTDEKTATDPEKTGTDLRNKRTNFEGTRRQSLEEEIINDIVQFQRRQSMEFGELENQILMEMSPKPEQTAPPTIRYGGFTVDDVMEDLVYLQQHGTTLKSPEIFRLFMCADETLQEPIDTSSKPGKAKMMVPHKKRRKVHAWAKCPETFLLAVSLLIEKADPFMAMDILKKAIRDVNAKDHQMVSRQLDLKHAVCLCRLGSPSAATSILMKRREAYEFEDSTQLLRPSFDLSMLRNPSKLPDLPLSKESDDPAAVTAKALQMDQLSTLGRCHKDLAQLAYSQRQRVKNIQKSFRFYLKAFNASKRRSSYSGINAASMAFLLSSKTISRCLATEVRRLCEDKLAKSVKAYHQARGEQTSRADTFDHDHEVLQTGHYWIFATMGECCVILGDYSEAVRYYRKGIAQLDCNWSMLASTRHQFRLLARFAALSYNGGAIDKGPAESEMTSKAGKFDIMEVDDAEGGLASHALLDAVLPSNQSKLYLAKAVAKVLGRVFHAPQERLRSGKELQTMKRRHSSMHSMGAGKRKAKPKSKAKGGHRRKSKHMGKQSATTAETKAETSNQPATGTFTGPVKVHRRRGRLISQKMDDEAMTKLLNAPAPAPAQTNAATSKQPETAAANKPRKRRQRYISQNMDDKTMAKLLNAQSAMASDSILSDPSPAPGTITTTPTQDANRRKPKSTNTLYSPIRRKNKKFEGSSDSPAVSPIFSNVKQTSAGDRSGSDAELEAMPDIVLPEGQSPPDIINELGVSIAAASAAVVVDDTRLVNIDALFRIPTVVLMLSVGSSDIFVPSSAEVEKRLARVFDELLEQCNAGFSYCVLTNFLDVLFCEAMLRRSKASASALTLHVLLPVPRERLVKERVSPLADPTLKARFEKVMDDSHVIVCNDIGMCVNCMNFQYACEMASGFASMRAKTLQTEAKCFYIPAPGRAPKSTAAPTGRDEESTATSATKKSKTKKSARHSHGHSHGHSHKSKKKAHGRHGHRRTGSHKINWFGQPWVVTSWRKRGKKLQPKSSVYTPPTADRLDVLRRGNIYLHFKDLKLLQHDDLKFCSKATRGRSHIKHNSNHKHRHRRKLELCMTPQVVMAIMFADVAGYSKLKESQVFCFNNFFMGKIASLVHAASTQDRSSAPVVRNTWGDGFYFVFNNVGAAGSFALHMRDLVIRTKWERYNLPKALSIRISLHAAPVFPCVDPVTEEIDFIGSHTSRAARIEPITPKGSVYCSDSFACVAASSNVRDFSCQYIGKVPLAKQYGVLGVHVVNWTREPKSLTLHKLNSHRMNEKRQRPRTSSNEKSSDKNPVPTAPLLHRGRSSTRRFPIRNNKSARTGIHHM